MVIFTHGVDKLLYELTSVIITSSATCSLILLINEVSVVIVISKTITVLISNFPTTCAFLLKKYIAVYKIKKESMFYL